MRVAALYTSALPIFGNFYESLHSFDKRKKLHLHSLLHIHYISDFLFNSLTMHNYNLPTFIQYDKFSTFGLALLRNSQPQKLVSRGKHLNSSQLLN